MMTIRSSWPAIAAAFASLGLARDVDAQTLTLVDALDQALSAHPAVAAAEARVLAAHEGSEAARAARLPTATLTASLTHFQEPMVVAPLHSLNPAAPPIFDRTLLQGQVGARYTLFDGGARGWRVRGADAVTDATRAARTSAGMRVLEEATGAFLSTLTARSMLEAASAQVVALDAERGRAQRHFDAGSAAAVEVLRAEAALQEARAAEATARAHAGLAERTLARLMGVDPNAVGGRDLGDVALRAEPARGNAGASPLVLQADRSVAAAQAHVTEERAARLPSVLIGAGVQDFGTAAGDHALEWRAGVEITWPIFTGGVRSASVRRAAADLTSARADMEAARLQVDQEVDAAIAGMAEADARLEALGAAVAQWAEVSRIEALAVEAGSGEQRDLLRAEAGLFEARAGRAAAQRDAILARVQLARAEGILSRDWIIASMETR